MRGSFPFNVHCSAWGGREDIAVAKQRQTSALPDQAVRLRQFYLVPVEACCNTISVDGLKSWVCTWDPGGNDSVRSAQPGATRGVTCLGSGVSTVKTGGGSLRAMRLE